MSARAGVDDGPQGPGDARGVVRALATVRVYTLLFSFPYVWEWTAGLSPMTRWAAVIAHGCGVVAATLWNDLTDADRGVPPHAGVTRRVAVDVGLARTVAWPIAGAAVIASLGLLEVTPLAPVLLVVALGVAWSLAHLPPQRKYLGIFEVAAPLLILVVPAVALAVGTDASPAWSTLVAGAAFLSALVLATHIRDRSDDIARRVPTAATRNLHAARGWLLLAALTGAVAACAALSMPLDGGEVLRAAAAVSFGAAAVVHRGTVPALTIAHGIFALSLLL